MTEQATTPDMSGVTLEQFERMIDAALNIAARSNDLAHVIRVASKLDGLDRIIGFLHDSLEDGYSTIEELVESFSNEIVAAVIVVSRNDPELYEDYIQRVIDSKNERAIRVKKVDLRVNLARAKVDRFSLVRRYERALKAMGE